MRFLPRCIGRYICLGALVAAGCGRSGTVSDQNVNALILQKPVTDLPRDSALRYGFRLRSGEYVALSVKKKANGLSISLHGPDGNVLRFIDCLDDGSVEISEVAAISGEFTVRLRSCDPGATSPFQITLHAIRRATVNDKEAVAAARLAAEGKLLNLQYRADSRTASIAKYQAALSKWRLVGNRGQEFSMLIRLAEVYRDSSDSAQAAQYVQRAISIALDNVKKAEATVMEATALLAKGDTSGALSLCNQAIELVRSEPDSQIEAAARYTLGLTYYDTGKYDDAVHSLDEARNIAMARGDSLTVARAVLSLAAVDFDLRRFDVGFEKARKALIVFRAYGARQDTAKALTYLGHFHSALYHKQEALNFYEEARAILIPSGDFTNEEYTLNGIARVHLQLGDIKAATEFYKLALDRTKVQGNPIDIAYALRSLGESYMADGNNTDALVALDQALTTFRAVSHKVMQSAVLQDIGSIMLATGKPSSAVQHFKEALEISRSIHHRQNEAWSLASLGEAREQARDIPGALNYYEKAMDLYGLIGHRSGRLGQLYRIANCLLIMGKLEDARRHSESAVEEIEKLRTSVTNPGLRTSFFASVRQQYDLLISILMQLYHHTGKRELAIQAFEASERSRARALLEAIGETRDALSVGVDPNLVQRESTLRALLDSRADYFTQLLSRNADQNKIAETGNEIQMLTSEMNQVVGQLRTQSPRYAALVQPALLTVAQIQNNLLDPDSVLLEYALGERNSYLWMITATDFASFPLPKRSEIERMVRIVRTSLTARTTLPGESSADYQARVKAAETAYPRAVDELSRALLGPVMERLKKRVVIVAEGALQYIPFAALTSASGPLVVQHEIVNLPSASTLAVIRHEAPLRSKPDRTVAVFADPVFRADDVRLSVIKSASRAAVPTEFARLPYTRREAEAILAMVPPERSLAALGFDATKTAAMNPDVGRYRVVHFATHTVLNDDHPDLSSLVLSLVDAGGRSQNGFLRLQDMYNLNLSADLVVLSACETALGKEVKGEGFISMVRGFMYAGTPRVIASLWSVDDEATAELMKKLYEGILQSGLRPAEALRQAQISQLQKKSRQSPYYWAGFQLQGEWK